MKSLIILLGLCFSAFSLKANIINVPGDSLITIQTGIDSAANGDTVLVAPGIYNGTIFIEHKSIVVGSHFIITGDTTYIDSTIIDGGNSSPVCWIQPFDTLLSVTLSGFTIQNGRFPLGGGIVVLANGTITISNNNIINNESDNPSYGGGGIRVEGVGTVNIIDNRISENLAHGEGGGIYIAGDGIHAAISGNIINNNTSYLAGGGIACLGSGHSNTIVNNNSIIGNNGTHRGGGIYIEGTNPTIMDNLIYDNNATQGGGFCCRSGSNAMISNNNIENNNAIYGSALLCDFNASPIFTKNVVAYNALNTFSSNTIFADFKTVISNNTFWGNNNLSGELINCSADSAVIINNIIAANSGASIFCSNSASIMYNNFYNQSIPMFTGSPPTGIGTISGINTNGDSCDVYYNIFLDPFFVDTTNMDFHLTENSPCIDAGDPATPNDSDGTLADIGAFYFDQSSPSISLSETLLDFGIVNVGEKDSLYFYIINRGTATLRLSAVQNTHPEFSSDWSNADSLISAGDSLQLMVWFIPADSSQVLDTLWIDNSDRPLFVELVGKGRIVSSIMADVDLPRSYQLFPASPNPFNPSTTIRFDLPRTDHIRLLVYDMLGRQIAVLVDGKRVAGRHEIVWHGVNRSGDAVSSGVYVLRMSSGTFSQSRKVLLLR